MKRNIQHIKGPDGKAYDFEFIILGDNVYKVVEINSWVTPFVVSLNESERGKFRIREKDKLNLPEWVMKKQVEFAEFINENFPNEQ